MFRPGGRATREERTVGDRMTPSLDKPQGLAPFDGRRRAGVTSLAFVALLGNVLLPALLSMFVLNEPGRDTPICGQWSGDAPGKAKSGLLVEHCPLCTVPAAALPRPPSMLVPGEVAEAIRQGLPTTVSVVPIRHGRMQARAPPSAV